MTGFYIGLIIGLILGVILGAKVAPAQITNEIGKIKNKGDNGLIEASQINDPITDKKRGLFRRIFKKKQNGSGN